MFDIKVLFVFLIIFSFKRMTLDIYGDGLALGNGEVSLYELVQAYTTLARLGKFKPLVYSREKSDSAHRFQRQIFSEEATSLIANILSDTKARAREFGSSGLLNFPIQTAVKTGTSSDYRDAWAIGFNYRYTVGVWMGNMSRESMKEVTGSTGPAFVLRSVFSELNKNQKTKPLYLSPKLVRNEICKETGLLTDTENTDKKCTQINEWFIATNRPKHAIQATYQNQKVHAQTIRIQYPSPNLQMAMDPRIPDDKEYFLFQLNISKNYQKVHWILDKNLLAETVKGNYRWQLEKGMHTLYAKVWLNKQVIKTAEVHFRVK